MVESRTPPAAWECRTMAKLGLGPAAAAAATLLAGTVALATRKRRKKEEEEAAAPPPVVTAPPVKLPPVVAPPKTMSPELIEEMAQAVLSQNPDRIDAVAVKLEKAGFASEATRLRVLAAELRKQQGKPAKPPTDKFGIPMEIPTVKKVPAADAAMAIRVKAATDLKMHLASTRRYKEDRKKVAAFQALMQLNQDRLYGPGTALASAGLGVIPVKPFYWPKKDTQASKKNYRTKILAYGQADPARYEQWAEAAQV